MAKAKRKKIPYTLINLQPLEQLRVAEMLFNLGSREVNVRELFTGSIGMKLFCLLKLNSYFPNLLLLERSKQIPEGGRVPLLHTLRHDALYFLCFRHEVDIKRAQRLELTEREARQYSVSEAEVAQYFADQLNRKA